MANKNDDWKELDDLDMPGKYKKARDKYEADLARNEKRKAWDLGLEGLAKIGAGVAGHQSLKDKNAYGQNIKLGDIPDLAEKDEDLAHRFRQRRQDLAQQEQSRRSALKDRMEAEDRGLARDQAQLKMESADPESATSKRLAEAANKLAKTDMFTGKSADEIKYLLPSVMADIKQKAALEAQTSKPKQPEAEKTMEREFGKTMAEYTTGGGRAKSDAAIRSLEKAEKMLEKSDWISGPAVSMLPEAVHKRIKPESKQVRDDIERVLTTELTSILGSQFTEKEGQRLLERTYDPALDEKMNADRVKELINTLRGIQNQKEAAIDHWKKYKNFDNFKGPVAFPKTANDFKFSWDQSKEAAPDTDAKRKRLEELRKKAGRK